MFSTLQLLHPPSKSNPNSVLVAPNELAFIVKPLEFRSVTEEKVNCPFVSAEVPQPSNSTLLKNQFEALATKMGGPARAKSNVLQSTVNPLSSNPYPCWL